MLSQKEVVRYLNQHSGIQMIDDMAAFFSVTPRTVRNHLRNLQGEYPGCLEVSRGRIKLLRPLP